MNYLTLNKGFSICGCLGFIHNAAMALYNILYTIQSKF